MGQDKVSTVAAVIVTCDPDLLLLEELLTAVSSQVSVIIVIDNGSSKDATGWLEQQRLAGRFELFLLQENLGLAAAQNRGICRATELGCTHVLLLDQDSIPAADMVARLLAAEERCLGQGLKVGVVGPRFIDSDTGAGTWFHGRGPLRYRYLKGSEADPLVKADLLIASGMLIRCDVLDDVGLMDDSLFIDLVDTEWCIRAAAAGYGIFGVGNAVMQHSIGSRSADIPGRVGRRGTFPVHQPLRYYYIFRNSLLMMGRAEMPGWWKLNNAMELLFLLFLIPLLAERSMESISMILKGVKDGFSGRRGRFPESE